jgi:hypothetical protein
VNKFARRQDANHTEVIEAYEALGCSVLDLSRVAELTQPGCPDLLVAWNGQTWLSETKTEVGALNPAQAHFIEEWKGDIVIVRSVEDVFTVVQYRRAHAGLGKFVARKISNRS